MKNVIRVGTRGSRLALWQAHHLQAQLAAIGRESTLEIIKTQGDRVQDLSFDKLEGKGFFTKEIEQALLEKRVDLAVHSMKDLPTSGPDGLVLAAVSERADPADWLLHRTGATESLPLQLPKGAKVGTSSARRKAQLHALRPDLELVDIRGNVPTRIEKLRKGQFDAIVLAAAGIIRLALDLSDLTVLPLNPKEFIPAPAQGVLAFQTRSEDLELRQTLLAIHHAPTAECTNVERRVLQLLEGGCHMPLGVYCEQDRNGNFHAWAALANDWQAPLVRHRISSSTYFQLAEQLFTGLREQIHVN